MRIFIIILFLLPLRLSAQLSISHSAGVGSYAMHDLKDLQTRMKKRFPLEGKIMSSFPMYWYNEASIKMIFDNNLVIGGYASYCSTGGRISYSDYSGGLNVDQLLECYSLSSLIGRAFKYHNGTVILEGYVMPGVSLTKYDQVHDETINDVRQKNSNSYRGFNIFVQPNVSLTKRYRAVGVRAGIGYYQTFQSGYLYDNDNEDEGSYLRESYDGKAITPDWSGIRLNVGFLIYFSKIENQRSDSE